MSGHHDDHGRHRDSAIPVRRRARPEFAKPADSYTSAIKSKIAELWAASSVAGIVQLDLLSRSAATVARAAKSSGDQAMRHSTQRPSDSSAMLRRSHLFHPITVARARG
jgi:hypothetical protein